MTVSAVVAVPVISTRAMTPTDTEAVPQEGDVGLVERFWLQAEATAARKSTAGSPRG